MNKLFHLLFFFLIILTNSIYSQNNRTITVEGTKTYNLSPNEIIVTIDYEEYYNGSNKVTIETIENQLINILNAENIKNNKITFGSITVLRPFDYETKTYEKIRLKKALYICLNNTKAYLDLTRAFEKKNLFNTIIKRFEVTELRHTQKEEYLNKSRKQAYLNAKEKAKLILESSSNKIGEVLKIEEKQHTVLNNKSVYALDNLSKKEPSGFKPIVVSYSLLVTFEIIN